MRLSRRSRAYSRQRRSVALSRGAIAQTLDRTKPPTAAAPAPFAFPKVQTRTLPNGLRVVLIEDHALPLVAVRAVVGVDSLDDPVGKEGLFVLTAGMLREGTTSMTADQLAAAIVVAWQRRLSAPIHDDHAELRSRRSSSWPTC